MFDFVTGIHLYTTQGLFSVLTLYLIFYSHGHMDHISAVPQHIKKRSLLGMKQALYHVPDHLVSPLTEACKQFGVISENTSVLEHPQIMPANPGDKIKVCRNLQTLDHGKGFCLESDSSTFGGLRSGPFRLEPFQVLEDKHVL